LIKGAVSGEFPCYAIGRNDETIALSKQVNVKGIIDDFNYQAGNWKGIPLFSSDQVEKNALVFNNSTSIAPLSVKKTSEKRDSQESLIFLKHCCLRISGFRCRILFRK
jgi:hypothetical protein